MSESRTWQVAWGSAARFNCGAAGRIKFSERMNTQGSSLCEKFRPTRTQNRGWVSTSHFHPSLRFLSSSPALYRAREREFVLLNVTHAVPLIIILFILPPSLLFRLAFARTNGGNLRTVSGFYVRSCQSIWRSRRKSLKRSHRLLKNLIRDAPSEQIRSRRWERERNEI